MSSHPGEWRDRREKVDTEDADVLLKYAAPTPEENEVVAVILGGGRGTRLYPLTDQRCKPAGKISVYPPRFLLLFMQLCLIRDHARALKIALRNRNTAWTN